MLQISGKKAEEVFKNEQGGHRWQRVPPTERKGRVHTSTITVSVLKEPEKLSFKIDEKDLQITKCRGSGAGGQHRNTTDSAVQIKHIPTGIMVRCESERSQHQNKDTAIKILRSRLMTLEENLQKSKISSDKKQQVGSGMRGDKRRTIRQQDGQVNDHLTGMSWRYEDYVKGIW
jgi:peptide chain release factor 1